MSVRIIAGERRGMALKTPKGLETRPTLGRVRESLFMILAPRLAGARVLDVFAGAGLLGLEALSRGAAHATFIEQARPALEAIRANIQKLAWEDRTAVLARDALASLRQSAPPGGQPFDLIFLDPPYGRALCAQALTLLAERRAAWLAEGGIIVAQHGRRDTLADSYGPLKAVRTQRYAETLIAFYSPEA